MSGKYLAFPLVFYFMGAVMKMGKFLLFALMMLSVASCDHPKTKDALRGLQGGLDEAAKQFGPAADGVSALTTEQLNKLSLIEYKVIPLPDTFTSSDMERVLAKAGEDRWDCFSVVPSAHGLNVFCRRLPYPMLREALRFM